MVATIVGGGGTDGSSTKVGAGRDTGDELASDAATSIPNTQLVKFQDGSSPSSNTEGEIEARPHHLASISVGPLCQKGEQGSSMLINFLTLHEGELAD